MVSLVFTKSQGLVGSFVNFNHFLFGDLAFHGPFPSDPFWAPLFTRQVSFQGPLHLHSFIGSFASCFQVPFLFFLSLLGFGPILLSSPAFFVKAFPWAMGLSYPCKAHGLFPWARSLPFIFWVSTKFLYQLLPRSLI